MALLLSDRIRKKSLKWLQEHRETHNVEQTKKMIPFVTRKFSFGWHVGEMVYIFDLGLEFRIDPVEQPIIRNSMGSGHVSQRGTSSFDNHLDYSFVVLKECTTETRLEKNVC